jgi:hypothetical protein
LRSLSLFSLFLVAASKKTGTCTWQCLGRRRRRLLPRLLPLDFAEYEIIKVQGLEEACGEEEEEEEDDAVLLCFFPFFLSFFLGSRQAAAAAASWVRLSDACRGLSRVCERGD